MDLDTLLSLLQRRRSVRRFLPEPVPRELVERLVEAARWAPSAGNRQAWRIWAVSDPAVLALMSGAVEEAVAGLRGQVRPDLRGLADGYLRSFLHFSSAPLVLVPVHKAGAGLLHAFEDADRPAAGVEGDDAHRAIRSREDDDALASAAAAVMCLLLAAEALGLGACWMTGPLLARERIARLLRIPEGWAVTALVPVGRPAETPPPPPRRDVARLLRWLA